MDSTGKAFVDHWSWAAKKGLMNPTTGRLMRNACTQVLSALDGWEKLDVMALNPDDVVARFRNLKGKKLTPRSLQDYRRRFGLALDSYRSYVENPEAWKGPGQERPTRPETNGSQTARYASKKPHAPQSETTNAALVEYPFPIRDLTARLSLPRDLKVTEAKRLTAFIMSLAIDSDAPNN